MHNSLSETWGDAHTDRLPSTVEPFHDSLVNYPDNIALICTHQDAGLYGISTRDGSFKDAQSAPYLRWTFHDLKLGVSRLEGSLRSLGVKTGTPIITLLPNCAEFVLTWWAAMEMGAFVAPLDPRRLSNASETKNNLETIMKVADDQPPVIVAFHAESLDFPGISSIPRQAAIVVSTTRETESHTLFKDLMMTAQDAVIDLTKGVEHEVTPPGRSCILFTSGSTSLPKGVIRRPNLQASFARDVFRTPGYETLPGDLWCCVTPNNHCVGINSLISPMLVGAGVLYPGEAFSAEATAQALLQERCTHMIMVPTNVSLIAEYLAEDTGDMRTSLKVVALAGSPPTVQTVETCLQVLGTRGVCVRYGSTEGLACDSEIVSNVQGILGEKGLLTVGRPVARDGVKICQPHGTDRLGVPLPRGMTGEIHYSAGAWRDHSMYIGREDTDDTCYTDHAGKRWLITGDEGMMDSQGRLYVVGRLKDMIIRGGENISPAAIEVRLANNPKLASKSIQIVGQPDPISGEVPIGVIPSGPDFSETAAEIYRCIRADMGLMWAPHEVIHLGQLGLEDWPRTSMGKVNRNTLRKLVHKRYEDTFEASGGNGGQSGAVTGDGHIRQQILRAWASALALDEEQLPLDVSISQFADSLSVAQVRGHLRRTVPGLGSISVRDVSGNNTLSEQIDLVVQAWRREGHNSPEESDHEGPPTPDEMLHTIGQPDLLKPTKTLVTEVIDQHGFRWDDVASVFPAQNFVDELSRNGMLDTLRFQYAFTTRTEGSLETVKDAFKAVLRANPLLPSFLVWDERASEFSADNHALHVTLKPSEKLYDQVLQDGGSVEKVEDLSHLGWNHPHPEWTLYPGILFRVLLFKVEATKSVGFVVSVSHGVMDASYIDIFLSDLDRALNYPPQPLVPHTSHKMWAESYYSFRESPQARASVRWHVEYLHGIQHHFDEAQWPRVQKRSAFDPTGNAYGKGALHSFSAPEIAALRKSHPLISPAVIIKAALALLNMHHTGHDHAVFAGFQAGRTQWPFMPASFGKHVGLGLFDEATDVAGPLVQSVTNLIKILPDESVLDMLHRLQTDQEDLTLHAHAPWPAIEETLDKAQRNRSNTGLLGSHRGLTRKICSTQVFNWIPGMGAQGGGLKEEFINFSKLTSVTRSQIGLLVRAGIGGPAGDTVILFIRGDGLTDGQKEEVAQKMEVLVRSLTRIDNWNAPISRCMLHEDVVLQESL